MKFTLGAWIVDALKFIESSTHVKRLAYGLVLAVLVYVIRWW